MNGPLGTTHYTTPRSDILWTSRCLLITQKIVRVSQVLYSPIKTRKYLINEQVCSGFTIRKIFILPQILYYVQYRRSHLEHTEPVTIFLTHDSEMDRVLDCPHCWSIVYPSSHTHSCLTLLLLRDCRGRRAQVSNTKQKGSESVQIAQQLPMGHDGLRLNSHGSVCAPTRCGSQRTYQEPWQNDGRFFKIQVSAREITCITKISFLTHQSRDNLPRRPKFLTMFVVFLSLSIK